MGKKVKGVYSDEGQLLMASTLMAHKPMMGVLFCLGVASGLRIGDLLALRVEEVGQKFSVFESKTGKTKEIELCDATWAILKTYIEWKHPSGEGRLFPTTRQTAHKYFKQAGDDLGLDDIGCHSTRKTYG